MVTSKIEHTGQHRYRRRCVAAALGVFLAVATGIQSGTPAVGAIPTSAPFQADTSQTVNSWALAPTGTDPTQPGSRSNLSYALAPGATIEDSVTLWNYGNTPLAFDVYATDAYNTSNGSFTLLNAGEKPSDAGAWAKLGIDHVTLPAETSLQIPLTLTIPAGASPGDHTAGVIATSKTPAIGSDGKEVLLDRRVGTRLYLRVSGPVTPQLEVEQVETSYHGVANPLDGSVDVSYTVRNTGNVRLAARQKVEVNDLFGTAATRRPADLAEILPGNAVTFREHFTGVAATVRVSSEVTLKPYTSASDVEPPAAFTRGDSGWAIPWALVALITVLLLAAWAVARWHRRQSSPEYRPRPATAS